MSISCAETVTPITPPIGALSFPTEVLQDPMTQDVWVLSSAFDSAYDGGTLTRLPLDSLRQGVLLDDFDTSSSLAEPFAEVVWIPQFATNLSFSDDGEALFLSTREEDNRFYKILLDENRLPDCPQAEGLIDCREAMHVKLPGNDLSAYFELPTPGEFMMTFASFSEIVMVEESASGALSVSSQVPLPIELINIQKMKVAKNNHDEVYYIGFGQIGFREDYTATGIAGVLISQTAIDRGLDTSDIQVFPLTDDTLSRSVTDFQYDGQYISLLARNTDALMQIPFDIEQPQSSWRIGRRAFVCEDAERLLSYDDTNTQAFITVCGDSATLGFYDSTTWASIGISHRVDLYPIGVRQIAVDAQQNLLLVPFFNGDSIGLYEVNDYVLKPKARFGDRRPLIEDRE